MTSSLTPFLPVLLSQAPLRMPLLVSKVCAGFPSPAEDLGAKRIDLTQELITHPQATYLMRAKGHSMTGAGIFDNDILVIDRAITPRHRHIVVAVIDGEEFTVKRLYHLDGCTRLQAANPAFADIVPQEGQILQIWGVVTASIKQFLV